MYNIFVDDTPAARDTVKRCLEAGGLGKVETYSSLNEFQSILGTIAAGDKAPPAMVLLDMQIGTDHECGLKMLDLSRQTLPQIPAIIVSMAAHSALVTSSYEKGASSYIEKNIDELEFEGTLKQFSTYWREVARLP